ncbi:hypothetical protein MPSEU_000181000 [Mayamaea pseudoterrestris]|nr:hypothetical protein MPSEU_000181000 [Mayamaea pseudoterrestris]
MNLLILAAVACITHHVGAFAPARQSISYRNFHQARHNLKSKQPLYMSPTDQEMQQNQVRAETESALSNVGWSLPQEGDLTSDDPFVVAIDQGIQRDFGVSLDELLNPAKVVNLERDLYSMRSQLAQLTGAKVIGAAASSGNDELSISFLTTAQCDAGGGGSDADVLRKKIQKKEGDLLMERRSVFRGWLKNVFLFQAVASFGLSYVMATHPESLFGGFGWFYSYNMDISIKVLGYWWWWLFVVPSLRSRRPKGFEKKALDIAFLGTPLISLLAPVLTRDTEIIWALNLAVLAASYGFAFATQDGDDSDDANQPEWLKFVFKSLDFGTGRERGARK